ncbi:MAG TPA: HAMP domain-containing sensor histidine kinase [Gemmatimonadaceae bacterium]|nr:HAMP domain-containing sensor histidine kinase [Gemmatimonadaceae bacterium]
MTDRAGAERPWAIVVLIALLATIGVLVYQTQSAVRHQRATAERALEHYADVASWELSRAVQSELQMTASVTTWSAVQRALRARPRGDTALPSPAALALLTETPRCDCPPALPAANVYRFVPLGDAVIARDRWRDGADSAHLARLFRSYVDTRDATPGADPCVLLVDADARDTAPRALAMAILRDVDEKVIAIYAVESELSALRPAIERAARRATLLPPALLDSSSRLRAISIAIRAGPRFIFRPRPLVGPRASTPLVLSSSATPVVADAAIDEAIAPQVLAGGLPSSRLPTLITLVVIVLMLLGIAVAQVRRSVALARLRGDFVASVSHELHTPLALMRVYTETLLLERDTSLEERRAFLRIVLREIRRLTALVEKVLTFSDIERGRVALSPAPLDTAALIRAVVADFAPIAEQRRAIVHSVIVADAGAMADAAALRQMLLNVLGNAVKYGPDGQHIIVRLGCDNERVLVSVDDEGPGIPPAQRARVFERYVRLGGSTNGGPTGSGIGLAIVAELGAAQGIEISIGDAPSGGARFTLAIPRASADQPQTPATHSAVVPA